MEESASQELRAVHHIESEVGNHKYHIISKAVNISHNQPSREGHLKSGT